MAQIVKFELQLCRAAALTTAALPGEPQVTARPSLLAHFTAAPLTRSYVLAVPHFPDP